MKNIKALSLCAITTSLSIALMFIGGISFIFAYVVPMFIGISSAFINSTFAKKWSYISYVATSLLSLMLVADKECAIIYIAIFGYYPIISENFNKIKSSVLKIIIKLLFFNITFAISQAVLFYVFGIPFIEEGEWAPLIAIFIVLVNIMFLIYDRLIIKVKFIYDNAISNKIKKLFK